MALSSELVQRLEAGEPLSKRLKLAENAYCSTDLAITGKHDTIVEWLCRVAPTDLVVWKTLSLCIHCHGSNNRACLTQETMRMLIDTLMEKLKPRDEPLGDEVLDFCNRILSAPELRQYFNTRLNKLCRFVRRLFLRIKSDGDYKRGGDGENFVLNAVENLVQIHKRHAEKDQLAEGFLNYVLSPLCSLVDPTCKDNSNRVGAEAHKCVQQILFAKGRYKEYKDYSQGRIEEGSLPAKLFPAIRRFTNGMDSDNVVATLSCVFGAAVASYKGDAALVDFFFRGLVDAAADFKADVANSLMEYLAEIPLDYENKIDDVSLTDYLGKLIDESIGRADFSSVEYSLLGNIARLNPLVVENRLPNIFKRILLAKRDTEFEERSYDRLVMGILNASSKLRREQKLIPWLLLALESSLGENKDCRLTAAQILPVDFCCKFTALVCGLQSPQITAMLRSLNFHFKSNCVEEYDKGSRNQVRLMTECTGSLLVSFFNGIHVYEHTVPLALQQKFVAAMGELGELLSALGGKMLNAKPDGRIIVVLYQAALSWIEVQSLLEFYAPESGAGNLPSPISENNLKKLIPIVENLGDKLCTNAANKFLLRRIQLDLNRRKPREKLTGIIGGLEASWPIIIEDYPALVSLLDFDQLSQLASLILKDAVAEERVFEKWEDLLQREILQEDEKLNAAILCHAFMKIGSIIKDCCAAAAIISRINLIEILKNETKDAAISSLDRRRPIKDVVQWLDLSPDDSTKIKKCLKILDCVPLIYLGAELRTMVFVTTYVIGREFKNDEGIASLCEKILFDTLEEGGINVFDFIDPTSLMPCLPGSKVLEKVFAMSLRNAGPSSQEDLATLENCPEEAVPVVLSCIENVKSKLNNERKQALGEVEKKLGKKALVNAKKGSKSVEKIRGLTQALRVAVGNNNVKGQLKKSISSTLRFIFMEIDDDDEEKNSLDENQNSNNNAELIRQGFELATIALQHRTRFDFPEKLVYGIWETVFKYPQTKLLPPLLEATPPTLLQEILRSLHNRTERDLREKDVANLNNTLCIWNCVIRSDMAMARSKSRLNATCKLLQSLHVMEIGAENWPDLIKLLTTIVNAKHMQLTGDNIDMISVTAFKSLREGDLLVYDDVLALCLALLRSRSEMMTDRLPIFLQLYRQAVVLIVGEAKKENATDRHRLALCALSVEKVSGALVKLKRDVARVSPYLIADLVNDFEGSELQPALKQSFANSLNTLMSICDPYGVNLLSRALPSSKREIFKNLHETYNKFHRFTGKI